MPLSSTFLKTQMNARKTLHIISTNFLEGNEVFVGFSDGSAAIFEAEELEKLRPVPKHTLPAPIAGDSASVYADFR